MVFFRAGSNVAELAIRRTFSHGGSFVTRTHVFLPQTQYFHTTVCNSILSEEFSEERRDCLSSYWSGLQLSRIRNTGVKSEILKNVGKAITTLPENFTLDRAVERSFADGAKMTETGEGIDWAVTHGYDGQNPEHSSGCLEYFLQTSDDNPYVIPEIEPTLRKQIQQCDWQVVNITTPANNFHVPQRQIHTETCRSLTAKPLVLDPIEVQLTAQPPDATQINMFEINSKLKELVKSGDLSTARKLFDELPHRDEISWTTMMSGYIKSSNSPEALSLFSNMWVQHNIQMDPFVLSLALKACGLNMNVKYGELLHGYCVKTDFESSVFVGSSLLDMYMKIGKLWEGCRVFDEMPLRNVVSWTAIITGLVRAGYNREGLMYFSHMWRDGVEYDSYTYAIALKACADIGLLNHGREIHAQTLKKGMDTSSYVANSLTTLYNKCGKLKYGLCLFDRMNTRDVVSWTTVIATRLQMGQEQSAIEAFLSMRAVGVIPNEYTFAAVISACANALRLDWGAQLHAHMVHEGLVDSLSVANSLMSLYSKCGLLDSARMVFHGMTRRDIVSWSTIIAGYAQGGSADDAFEFLSLMRREGPKPTEFAFASVLSVCGCMAILDQGRQLHAHVLIVGLNHTAMVQSALINMYAKCGSIKEASMLFDTARNDDIISWTAMINGYAEHGYSQEAINLFQKLSEVGLQPDSVTFIGVLTACSHVGLVDLGYKYFKSMSEDHGIAPSKEHYGCMIDLLCRAGRLNDAEHMIKSMPLERDDVVWSTLLRACRVHGDVECGRRTAEKLLKVDPNCAGTHITLANIYASKGKWREAAGMRKLMKSKGILKEPGWSWIKVKDQVTSFVSGDKTHSACADIYNILDLLASKAENAVEGIGSDLNDIEDEWILEQ